MSLRVRGFSAAILAATLAGAAFLPASPAQAAAPSLSAFLFDSLLGADSDGTVQRAIVVPSEPMTVTGYKIEFDYSGLAGVATVELRNPNSRCRTSESVLTCDYGENTFYGPTSVLPEVVVKPVTVMIIGAIGTWKVTVSADGLAPTTDEATVKVAEGVDLGVPTRNLERQGAPGQALPQSLEIDNVGETTANGAVAIFYGDPGIVATKQYSNCTYTEGRPETCTFDEQLAAGGAYRTSEAFPFGIGTDSLAPGNEFLEVEWMTKADFAIFLRELAERGIPNPFGQSGTGAKLTLVTRPQSPAAADQTDIDRTDNFLQMAIEVTGDNDADFAAKGGSAPGAAGQVVTLSLGFKNLGPASRDTFRVGGPVGEIDITLPPGSSLTEMPEDCHAMKSIGELGELDPDPGNLAARFIRCVNPSSYIKFGTEVTFPVKLRIDQVISSASGSVAILTSGCDGCREDKNPANDTAAVVLNGPSLPTTGVQTGLIAGAGVLLALLGVAAFVFGRRRRPSIGQ